MTREMGLQQKKAALLQSGMLVLVLLFATAYRFYHIDQAGLWGVELANAVAVLNIGWQDLVTSLVYGNPVPPGYKSLLYFVGQWLGRSAFEFRLLSALAGIGSVLMVYVLGRRIHSPSAGLLAAAALAGSFHAINYSQEVQVSSVLMLAVLMNFYCFLSVFFPDKGDECEKTMRVEFNAMAGHLSFVWQPPVDVRPQCLLMFWITGVLLTYLHYVAWIVLLVEAVLVMIFHGFQMLRDKAAKLLLIAFFPVVLLFLPWVPAAIIQFGKAWNPSFFEWEAWFNVLAIYDVLLGNNPLFGRILVVLAGLAVISDVYVMIAAGLRSPERRLQNAAFMFVVLVVAFFLVCGCFMTVANNKGVYLVLHPLVLLVCAVVVARLLHALFSPLVASLMVLVLFMVIVCAQFSHNLTTGLFSDQRKPDVRPLLRLISRDKEFMSHIERQVFVSFSGINHYLDRYGIVPRAYGFVVNSMDSAEADKVNSMLSQRSFYYVGVVDRPRLKHTSPFLEMLLQRYGVLCRSSDDYIRIVKFSKDLPPSPGADVADCASRDVFLDHSTVADRVKGL